MRGIRKRSGAHPALLGLVAALLLSAGLAIAGEATAPTADETPDAAEAQTVVPRGDDVREAPADRRWSYLRPRFAGGGLKVHIDPQTGSPVEPPEKARRETALPVAFSHSHEGLKVVTLPNGYRYVETRGRLMNALAATVGEDGEVKLGHAPPTPGETEGGEAATAEAGEDLR